MRPREMAEVRQQIERVFVRMFGVGVGRLPAQSRPGGMSELDVPEGNGSGETADCTSICEDILGR